jgi:uncharacterized protein YndB with AHSA1/START domain
MSTVIEQEIATIDIHKEIEIAAPLEIAFQALLEELGPESQVGDGTPMPMKLEAFPGGRWYRDLGNNAGHFWGHVQVIKPPTLLEIVGPMFMSYPAASHLQYRLKAQGQGTLLTLIHKAFGFIPSDHREGVNKGWQHKLDRVRELAEKMRK